MGGIIRPKISSFWKLSLPKQWELDVNVKHHSQSVVLSLVKTGRGSLKLYGSFSGLRRNNLFSKHTTKDGESRRSDTMIYMLKAKGGKIVRVCKKMFLSQTGLTGYFVRTYADVKERDIAARMN